MTFDTYGLGLTANQATPHINKSTRPFDPSFFFEYALPTPRKIIVIFDRMFSYKIIGRIFLCMCFSNHL
jgi:hypothetical protein